MPSIETGMAMKDQNELFDQIGKAQSNRLNEQRVELPISLRNSWCSVPSLAIKTTDNNQETEESDNSREEQEIDLEEDDEGMMRDLDPVIEVQW